MPITLRDIAAHAGVSLPTVSQILSPSSKRAGLFSKVTREKVEIAAVELGYRPNTSARPTATGRFGAVTLLLSHHSNRSQVPPALLAGIDERLAEADLHLIVARLPDQKLTDAGEAPKLLRQLACDGLLINYNAHIPTRMIELIERHRIPSVWINSKQARDCVHPDDEKAAYGATRLLIKAGHRRIAYVDYTSGPKPVDPHYSVTDRRAGYARAMRQSRYKQRIVCGPGNIPVEDRIAFTREWLDALDSPTGVFCYTHQESAAILVAADRMGLSIPQDLSIVTVHDEAVRHFDVALPTAVLPEHEIGRIAVGMLLERIGGSAETSAPIAVPLVVANAGKLAAPR